MLDKSFRCTNEILNFSLKFIEQSSQIKSFNRNGDSPKVYIADNSEIFIDEIVKEIKLCQEKGFQSICLICKTEKNSTYLFNKIKHKLDIQLIKNGSVSDLQTGRVYRGRRLPHFMVRRAFGTACGSCRLRGAI